MVSKRNSYSNEAAPLVRSIPDRSSRVAYSSRCLFFRDKAAECLQHSSQNSAGFPRWGMMWSQTRIEVSSSTRLHLYHCAENNEAQGAPTSMPGFPSVPGHALPSESLRSCAGREDFCEHRACFKPEPESGTIGTPWLFFSCRGPTGGQR